MVNTAWPAPAKINLFLHVVGRRADGYHLLQTVFQFLDLADELEFCLRDDGVVVRATEITGIAAESDLVVRAARLLQTHTECSRGVEISITKRIPVGGGLGGGSSDAATVLVALNELWQLGLDTATLSELGLTLGADVPVFVEGQAAWGEGVGDVLEPFNAEETAVLVVTPNCPVDTARVFAHPDLTRATAPIKMHAFSLPACGNDCEPITRMLYPEVGRALDWLSQFTQARMSGTGASVFAFFDSVEDAKEVALRAPKSWVSAACRRSNRSLLRDRVARERAS